MRKIAALSILLACAGFVTARDTETTRYAPWVSCFDDAGEHFRGPKTVKTRILTSPDERFRAFAEIEAKHDSKQFESCENTAILYVSVSGGSFQPVITESKVTPEDPSMSSLGPAAWSSDSRWLFVERGLWSYASDFCGYGFVLYDAVSGKIVEPDILGAVLRKTGKRCDVGYNGFVGFNGASQLIVRISYSLETKAGEVSCAAGSADWLFDPVTNQAHPRAEPVSP